MVKKCLSLLPRSAPAFETKLRLVMVSEKELRAMHIQEMGNYEYMLPNQIKVY